MSSTPCLAIKCLGIQITDPEFDDLNWAEQQDMIDRILAADGSREAARETFKAFLRDLESRATIFTPKPPEDFSLQSTNIGPYKLFYHLAVPEDLRAWSFYFGLADQGRESIIEYWRREGISVSVKIYNNRWVESECLVVGENARVRISYNDEAQEKKTEELVFPQAPGEPYIPTRYL
ncbi:hypothetical protein DL96DRAFT_1554576 [Flagelloscypha sp. PMI_526]|nr:hypothetical protein DL96DRAFT_1554576 [Flagelloscypha sp. PMI_526]